MSSLHQLGLLIEKTTNRRTPKSIHYLSGNVCVIEWEDTINGRPVRYFDLYYRLSAVETRRGDLPVNLHDDADLGVLHNVARNFTDLRAGLSECLRRAKTGFCRNHRLPGRVEIPWHRSPKVITAT